MDRHRVEEVEEEETCQRGQAVQHASTQEQSGLQVLPSPVVAHLVVIVQARKGTIVSILLEQHLHWPRANRGPMAYPLH